MSRAPKIKLPTTAPAIIPPEGDFEGVVEFEDEDEVVEVEGRDDVEAGKSYTLSQRDIPCGPNPNTSLLYFLSISHRNMSHNYALRPNFNQLDSDDLSEELEAQSTIGATSSPPGPHLPDYDLADDIPFGDLNSDDFIDDDNDSDDTYDPVSGRAPKTTSTEKALIEETISRLFKQIASRRKLPFKQVFNLNTFNGTVQ
ncbi:hypothetical protein C8J57DRAFT_1594587 [Mycena rebaudengoi]|nr:hypothetical protein C8J57DRAFT_1594587 [Mycena rebaudengoi]